MTLNVSLVCKQSRGGTYSTASDIETIIPRQDILAEGNKRM